jgi:methylenetetrahydrofolate--tRNA-(uracil-5-)-methyltransferase
VDRIPSPGDHRGIESHPRIEVRRGEVRDIPEDGIVVIATGPLTGEALAERIGRLLGRRSLYFYDAISPIVYADTVDFTGLYRASRYGKGDDDYVNIPLDLAAYEAFVAALVKARRWRPTSSRRRSTSRGACRSRCWRPAGPRRSPTGR